MDCNLDAKFGPPPPVRMPAHVVLLGQLAVCAALLAVLQPPFCLDGASLCPVRVLLVAAATTGATWALHLSGTSPGDTFRGACELLSRAAAR